MWERSFEDAPLSIEVVEERPLDQAVENSL